MRVPYTLQQVVILQTLFVLYSNITEYFFSSWQVESALMLLEYLLHFMACKHIWGIK